MPKTMSVVWLTIAIVVIIVSLGVLIASLKKVPTTEMGVQYNVHKKQVRTWYCFVHCHVYIPKLKNTPLHLFPVRWCNKVWWSVRWPARLSLYKISFHIHHCWCKQQKMRVERWLACRIFGDLSGENRVVLCSSPCVHPQADAYTVYFYLPTKVPNDHRQRTASHCQVQGLS